MQKGTQMAAQRGNMSCNLYQGAFSGEAVFEVTTASGDSYQGIAPKHYVKPSAELSKTPVSGAVFVRVVKNGGKEATVTMPDGQTIEVNPSHIEMIE